jgi:hypothetical protein
VAAGRVLVDRILRGKKLSDLPVQASKMYQTVFNPTPPRR